MRVGASVLVENSEGETALQLAECTKHSAVIKLLQEVEETGGKSPRNTEGEWRVGLDTEMLAYSSGIILLRSIHPIILNMMPA